MKYVSPSGGVMSLDKVFDNIMSFVSDDASSNYRLIIGTDSHSTGRDGMTFVSAIIIHRRGKGARYYYHKVKQRWIKSLRQRIFYEASMSLNLASKIAQKLSQQSVEQLDVEIHLDVGLKGDTKDLIREVTGMILGSGFDAKIKPESYGASKVADKHTK